VNFLGKYVYINVSGYDSLLLLLGEGVFFFPLSGEETPKDPSSAFTRENVHKYLDFGSKAEVELDERIAMAYSDLVKGQHDAKKKLNTQQEQVKAVDAQISIVETELQRLVDLHFPMNLFIQAIHV
jgi:hypothetical protein